MDPSDLFPLVTISSDGWSPIESRTVFKKQILEVLEFSEGSQPESTMENKKKKISLIFSSEQDRRAIQPSLLMGSIVRVH